jgi:glycosyltransferase involved in cell wall biosynthesis
MSTPKVSILIPTYNYASFIGEAVDSALEQTFTDFEIVIVDDASADHTEAICRRFVESDRRVRYVRNSSNLGMVRNWNHSLSMAQGKYVKLLLADDRLWGTNVLALQVAALEADSSLAIVTSSRTIIDEHSIQRDLWNPLGRRDQRIQLREVEHHMRMRVGAGMNMIGEPSAVMFRRCNAGHGFSESLRQLVDFEMWLRQLQYGDLWYFADPLCAFRRHGNQQSALNSKAATGELEELEIVRSYFARRPAGNRFIARAERLVWRRWRRSANVALRGEADMIRQRLRLRDLVAATLAYRLVRLRQNAARLLSGRSKRFTQVVHQARSIIRWGRSG